MIEFGTMIVGNWGATGHSYSYGVVTEIYEIGIVNKSLLTLMISTLQRCSVRMSSCLAILLTRSVFMLG